MVTLMDVYEKRIRFGELGGKMFTERVSISRLEPIRREIIRGVLDGLQTSLGVGRHERELWIEVMGHPKVGFLAEDSPEVLESLLRAVRIFSRKNSAVDLIMWQIICHNMHAGVVVHDRGLRRPQTAGLGLRAAPRPGRALAGPQVAGNGLSSP